MGEGETMVKQMKIIQVDPEDLRVAKGIASFKGMTLRKYFSSLIDDEGMRFQKDISQDIYRRRKRQ